MKIRNSFVSNSSSSSFITGYGVIDTKKYEELIKFIKERCDYNESFLIGLKKDLAMTSLPGLKSVGVMKMTMMINF